MNHDSFATQNQDRSSGQAGPGEAPPLSSEQWAAVNALADGVRQGKLHQTLGGYAGTGKSTTIRALKAQLGGFACCAYTGRAASVLRRKGIPASTIHSLIYIPWPDSDGQIQFRLRDEDELDFDILTGFIVDEASMVGSELCRDLMSFGLPCIFVGDHGQLPPVEAERTGFNLMANPDYTLEHVHRHAGEIPRFAEWLRLGRPARDFQPQSDAVVLLDGEVSDQVLRDADQVIVAFNRTRVGLNTYLRKLAGRQARIEVGERVICLRNSREENLQNGLQGEVVTVVKNRLDLMTDDGPRTAIAVDLDRFGCENPPASGGFSGLHPFDYAYAITCHKAQGGEWRSVLVVEERCPHWDHRRWAYTAASRAQRKLWWLLPRSARKGGVR